MGPSARSRQTDPLLIASVLLTFVIITTIVVTGCGSLTGSGGSLTTMTTIPAESTVVTQSSGADAQGPGATVTIHNGNVDPTELHVAVGGAVTFRDADDDTTRTYQLVASDGSFDTGVLSESDTYVITFQKPGTHEYQDKNDPSIKGTIVVQ
jgi:plastocyanin